MKNIIKMSLLIVSFLALHIDASQASANQTPWLNATTLSYGVAAATCAGALYYYQNITVPVQQLNNNARKQLLMNLDDIINDRVMHRSKDTFAQKRAALGLSNNSTSWEELCDRADKNIQEMPDLGAEERRALKSKMSKLRNEISSAWRPSSGCWLSNDAITDALKDVKETLKDIKAKHKEPIDKKRSTFMKVACGAGVCTLGLAAYLYKTK